MKVAVIGGGASGFFSAINLARQQPSWQVDIHEKSSKLLSKVKVSGGGRCNVTHHCFEPIALSKNYPRGGKRLSQLFKLFGPEDMEHWFSERNVSLKTESDGRMFPNSNHSQTIIDTFLSEAQKHQVGIHTRSGLKSLHLLENGKWSLSMDHGRTIIVDKVIMATGGQPSVWKLLEQLGLDIVPAVPSLFTFNCKDTRIAGLQGLSFPYVQVKVAGTKLVAEGPLLITHWGFSGPAILRLSAWGARALAEKGYDFTIMINFMGKEHPREVGTYIADLRKTHPKKLPINESIPGIPKRYWQRITETAMVRRGQPLGELAKKQSNKLMEELAQATFNIQGKSTFKEEFVTCGGVSLSEINFSNLEAKRFPGLHFTGEVLDIDAITGGFNFQACWTTAWILAEQLSLSNTSAE